MLPVGSRDTQWPVPFIVNNAQTRGLTETKAKVN